MEILLCGLALGCQPGAPQDTGEAWDEDRQVEVPEGAFTMGCDRGEDDPTCPADASPAHEVVLSGFWIDRLEVQVGDYGACIQAGGCTPPTTPGVPTDEADLPVTSVSLEQADNYCAWRGKRLPTEAEWEKAARGTDGRAYPWGDTPADCTRARLPWCGDRVGPAGAYPRGASPYGALDMVGNAWELVADFYGDTYYAESPTNNPGGPDASGLHLARGASLMAGGDSARVTRRVPTVGDNASPLVGFRCVEER